MTKITITVEAETDHKAMSKVCGAVAHLFTAMDVAKIKAISHPKLGYTVKVERREG